MSGKCTTTFFDAYNSQYYLPCYAALLRQSNGPVSHVTIEKMPTPTSPQQTGFFPCLTWSQFQCLLKCVEKKTGSDIHGRCYQTCLRKPYNPASVTPHPFSDDRTAEYDDDPASPSN